jgi:murein DD-endopeptidase MepM/ murein hydrolase activator NlpD
LFNFLKKDLSLWLVSPTDGKVRRYNLQASKLVALIAFSLFLVFGFLFVASDYTRVQVLRAYNHFRAVRLDSELNSLITSNHTLRLKLRGLEKDLAKNSDFEYGVKEKLAEISGLLDNARKLGVLPAQNNKLASKKSKTEAMGGPEIDCKLDKTGKCEKLLSESGRAGYVPSSFQMTKRQTYENRNLLNQLDSQIQEIKLVPIGSPVIGKMSSGYGYRKSPFSGRIKLHQGVDFSLKYGSKIHATAYGKVVSVKRTRTYGLLVDIEHSKGIITRYAHLSRVNVKVGQDMGRGDILGFVGSSGRSTGPHLHYEVLVKGKAINPYSLIDFGKIRKPIV